MIAEIVETCGLDWDTVENNWTRYKYNVMKLRQALKSEREKNYMEKNKSNQPNQ